MVNENEVKCEWKRDFNLNENNHGKWCIENILILWKYLLDVESFWDHLRFRKWQNSMLIECWSHEHEAVSYRNEARYNCLLIAQKQKQNRFNVSLK